MPRRRIPIGEDNSEDEEEEIMEEPRGDESPPPPEEEPTPQEPGQQRAGGGVDDETLRIMLSTDNHLGYCEKDPIRGSDSFAALEEVLSLARRHKCDMVLLAGDLFHDNKPSRRTLHKTMEILRRYCMGPNPVQFQIVSDQAANFRSVHGTVNYEDSYYSVDLPIFSIHGNHDDPTRDGGTEMLAALDLLSVSNLVNYFGRHDEVDKVEVSPILIRKGSTRVALYGMGSMRDERLNRMWQGKKVRFLRPEVDAEDDDDEENAFFNIFALHQNRDLGRGSKNCVHESMIPEWMDLVVWGHEHECLIEAMESAVGTYRITQPGSSVATSLSAGESVRKHVGILDVRGNQFRINKIPLSQVRSFSMGEVSLNDFMNRIDPDDPKIDDIVSDLLAKEVTRLIKDAREKNKFLMEDAEEAAKAAALESDDFEPEEASYLSKDHKYKIDKPDQVLVRLRVEHSGFSTLNNQRFGAKFVGDVANPSDILLFHRRRQGAETTVGEDGKPRAKKKKGSKLDQPLAPDDLEELNVEDLVKDNLESSEKKLELLHEPELGLALEDFVSKEQRQAINEAVADLLSKSQKKLIKRGAVSRGAGDDAEGANKITTATAIREVCKQESEQARINAVIDAEEEGSNDPEKEKGTKVRREEKKSDSVSPRLNYESDDSLPVQRTKKTVAKKVTNKRSRNSDLESDEDDDEIEIVAPPTKKSKARPARKATVSSAVKGKYTFNDDGDDAFSSQDEVLSEVEEETPRPKKRSRATPAKKSASKQTSMGAFTSSRKSKAPPSRTRKRVASYNEDDSDEDGGRGSANGLGADWGTANTESSEVRPRGRR